MTSVIILKSEFIKSLKNKRPEFSQILGQDISYYINKAVSGSQWTVYEDGFNLSENFADNGSIIVLNEASVGISQEILYRFLVSDQLILTDYYAKAGAIKIDKDQAKQMEDSFDQDFDSFYRAWAEAYFPEELKEDSLVQDQDSVDLDIPVIESYEDFYLAEGQMAFDINFEWIKKGVMIEDPNSCRIGPEVSLGSGSRLIGRVSISGKSSIGKNCLIIGESFISDSRIEDGVVIRSSIIEESIMEEESNIGPFSHLRPNSRMGKKVHVGNFVELKKASLDQGTKAGHLTYIGDAEVGKDVNISCGVIFCNYDGKNKHKTKVGDGAFLGSNANLVAPVNVAKDAFIAAGSTVTKDVEEGDLFLERAKEKLIKGYVKKRKEEGSL